MALDTTLLQYADKLAEQVLARIRERVEVGMAEVVDGKARNGNGVKRPSPAKGTKRDMRCRVVGCANKSKGPRFKYFCEKHQSLTAKQKDEATREFAAKNSK